MRHYLRTLRRKENLFTELLKPRLPSSTPEKILIDYSSPNVAKQFHVGNLRSTLVGRFIDSLNRVAGNDVIAVNYIGDWGSQFALMAAHWSSFKPPTEEWESKSDSHKLDVLTKCYVAASKLASEDERFLARSRDIFARVERGDRGDEGFTRFWNEVNEISMRHLSKFYDELNVRFDVVMRESEYYRAANALIDSFVERGLASKTADGATVIKGPGIDKYAVVRKSDNSSLYISREIAAMLERERRFAADKYIFVVDSAQCRHFLNLKALLSLMGRQDLAAKVHHIPFGRVIGLSTRKGKTESVSDIVAHGCELAEKFVLESKTLKVDENEAKEVARKLSLSSIVVNDLKRARRSEYTFSFDKAFKMNQVNALLLQMKHSRLYSLEQYNADLMKSVDEDWPHELELNDETLPLVRHLQQLDDALVKAHLDFEPCRMTVFLVKLANLTGSAMSSLRVANEVAEKALPRLLLFSAARRVLHDGMKLIGIEPLNQM